MHVSRSYFTWLNVGVMRSLNLSFDRLRQSFQAHNAVSCEPLSTKLHCSTSKNHKSVLVIIQRFDFRDN